MRTLFFAFLILSVIIPPCYPEIIKLKNGKTVEGKIIERTDKYIRIDFYGVPLTYYHDGIESINGKKVTVKEKKAIGKTSGPVSLSDSLIEKPPSQIFQESTPAVVSVRAFHPNGLSLGTGFIIDNTGLILTSAHVVVEGSEAIDVQLSNGEVAGMTAVKWIDFKRDFCIFQIDKNGLPFLRLGNSDALGVGQMVIGVGIPDGESYKKAVGNFLRKREFYGYAFFQVSADMSQGWSGGPLLNGKGEVIGIYAESDDRSKQMNFVIPINEIKTYINLAKQSASDDFDINEMTAYRFFAHAKSAYLRGDYDEAIQLYKRAIDTYPDVLKAYCDLGRTYILKNKFNDAVAVLQKAIDKDPACGGAYHQLALAYMQLGKSYKGIELFKQAIQLDPFDARSYASLGFAYTIIGELDNARSQLKKSIELDPTFGVAHEDLLRVYLLARQYDLAVKHYNKALELGYEVDPQVAEQLKAYR